MELKIISPQQTLIYLVAWVEIETSSGNFVIQPGHAPMVVTLSPNQSVIFKLKNGKQESIIPRTGIAQVTRQNITLLVSE